MLFNYWYLDIILSQISYENFLIFSIFHFCYCCGGEDEELKKKVRNYSSRTRKIREGFFVVVVFFFQLQNIKF